MEIKHQITIEFEQGEKCFCCNEYFEKPNTLVKTFDTKSEADEFKYLCDYLLNVVNGAEQLSDINQWAKKKIIYNQIIGNGKDGEK